MRITLNRAKRRLEAEPVPYIIKKKLRSELPRRRRSQFSPILYSSLNFLAIPLKNSGFSFSLDSTSCSYFGSEVSCDSSRVSVGLERNARLDSRKEQFGDIRGSKVLVRANEVVGDARIRRVTRSCYRRKENEGKGGEVEVPELSCVESSSGADAAIFRETSSKLKSESGKGSENVKEIKGNDGSEVVSKSEIYSVRQLSDVNTISSARNMSIPSKFKQIVPVSSGVESCSVANLAEEATEQTENRALEFDLSEISGNLLDANFMIPNSESTVDQKQMNLRFDSDLACTEQFSYEDMSEYSSSHETAFSDLQSEFFLENSEQEFSDYTLSSLDSGSQFSERSEEDSTSSHTFSLLLQYREEFSRSTTPLDRGSVAPLENEHHDQATYMRFEDEADEESYKALRERERRTVSLHNYAEEYCSRTEYGDLVLQQRLQMVHWIVEQSTEKRLQQETMFLGVSLLDRFLCKGFFRDERNLQIVGIACLTLATRIEENQPHNSVREDNFCIGSNVYSRCEVVAMEWLVQELLNFQCFLPTIYNFLWFYLKVSKADAEVESRAKFLAVLVVFAGEQLCYWPSTVAAVLVILASLESSQEAFHQRVIKTHIRTEDQDLNECIESLEWLLRYI
ncbi:cyclin-SDS isoform X2 [Carya illinoinensis]|uniref:Cyclin-like domain-containing protein n=2 Tax=Carya illinoinensis TaxID=32201 RepID=A0A8T1Q860_CARIL|nr:cyclin-SDS isoform X2 [Carya illinoinensis]KAG6650603.1 hypothetical protein CIPAW_06G055200 [Carya illinoinensis]